MEMEKKSIWEKHKERVGDENVVQGNVLKFKEV